MASETSNGPESTQPLQEQPGNEAAPCPGSTTTNLLTHFPGAQFVPPWEWL